MMGGGRETTGLGPIGSVATGGAGRPGADRQEPPGLTASALVPECGLRRGGGSGGRVADGLGPCDSCPPPRRALCALRSLPSALLLSLIYDMVGSALLAVSLLCVCACVRAYVCVPLNFV